jgi:hypothetical protein
VAAFSSRTLAGKTLAVGPARSGRDRPPGRRLGWTWWPGREPPRRGRAAGVRPDGLGEMLPSATSPCWSPATPATRVPVSASWGAAPDRLPVNVARGSVVDEECRAPSARVAGGAAGRLRDRAVLASSPWEMEQVIVTRTSPGSGGVRPPGDGGLGENLARWLAAAAAERRPGGALRSPEGLTASEPPRRCGGGAALGVEHQSGGRDDRA